MGEPCHRFYWGCDPISYAQKALAINEFAAPRWQNLRLPNGESVGNTILDQRNIPHEQWWIWCAPSALSVPYGVYQDCVSRHQARGLLGCS